MSQPHDPGDAVPPGVAPAEAPQPGEQEKAPRERLRCLRDRSDAETTPERDGES